MQRFADKLTATRPLSSTAARFNGLLGILVLFVVPSQSLCAAEKEAVVSGSKIKVPALVSAAKQSESLSGIAVREGVQVSVAADAPTIVQPVAMAFDQQGMAYLIERRQTGNLERTSATITYQDGTQSQSPQWTTRTEDVCKQLVDRDGDGRFEAATSLMTDLKLASSIVIDDGWMYFATGDRIVRRRIVRENGAHEPISIETIERLKLTAPLASTDIIEEVVFKGISGFDSQLLHGLAMSPDGWLYASLGAGDHRLEGADGSRSVALRSGTIVRCRPNGAGLHEVARGLRSPAGAIVFDALFNAFQIDGDSEPKSPLSGTRLLHVLEGDDFGWRLATDATSIATDMTRSTLSGDRPGTTAAVCIQDASIPRGAATLHGSLLPEWAADLIVYADPIAQRVMALRVERQGSTFKLVDQFELLAAQGDSNFRPSSVVFGPDGTLYVLDARRRFGADAPPAEVQTQGRIYRLVFGEKSVLSRDTLKTLMRDSLASNPKDAASVKSKSAGLMSLTQRGREPYRSQLIHELATKLKRELGSINDVTELAKFASLDSRSDSEQATFFAALCRGNYDAAAQMLIVEYATRESDIGRIASDFFIRNATIDITLPHADTQIARLKFGIKSASAESRRTSAAALSKIGQLYRQRDAEQIRQLTTVLTTALLLERSEGSQRATNSRLVTGLVHAVERLGEPAIRQVSTSITQPRSPNVDLAISALEAMHSRPAARILDAILFSNTSHLSPAQLSRLVRTYRHIQVDPPINLATLTAFLTADPDLDEQVRLDGLETLLACVTTDNAEDLSEAIQLLVDGLKASSRSETRSRLEKLMKLKPVPAPSKE